MDNQELINKLQALYNGDRFAFEMASSIYLAGEEKKDLRHQIIYQVTGRRLPIKKCTHLAAAAALKIKFDQPTLF